LNQVAALRRHELMLHESVNLLLQEDIESNYPDFLSGLIMHRERHLIDEIRLLQDKLVLAEGSLISLNKNH